MKGISFTESTSKVFTPNLFRYLLKNREQTKTVEQSYIKKSFMDAELKSVTYLKQIRFGADKRWFVEDDNENGRTLPYGFVKPE